MSYLVPEEQQLESFLKLAGDSKPIELCHLLKFKAVADYSDHPDEIPCSGKEAYHRYLDQAIEYIREHSGKLLYNGDISGLLIGPSTESWDEVLLVSFPNIETVTEMMTSQKYQDIGHHRLAGLEDTRLFTLTARAAN